MESTIDSRSLDYRELNMKIRELAGLKKNIRLINVNGQRYIGTALSGDVAMTIDGVPGNDLAAFMNGAQIVIWGNVQDAAANTMNEGRIVVHGSAGDALGYGMRGGLVLIRDDVGYRAGIHMKEYGSKKPVLVIGGTAGDFLGEYMAGGIIVVMNRQDKKNAVGSYCGSGMHGGRIFIRCAGPLELGPGVMMQPLDKEDIMFLDFCIKEYQSNFEGVKMEIRPDDFIKLVPESNRPYHKLYAGV